MISCFFIPNIAFFRESCIRFCSSFQCSIGLHYSSWSLSCSGLFLSPLLRCKQVGTLQIRRSSFRANFASLSLQFLDSATKQGAIGLYTDGTPSLEAFFIEVGLKTLGFIKRKCTMLFCHRHQEDTSEPCIPLAARVS